MKKLFVMMARMMAALTVNAQNDDLKNEIGVYYGFASASNIASSIGTAFNWDSSDQTGFWGPVGIEYYRHLTPVVAVGAVASIAGCTWSKNDDFSSKYYTVMPSVKFNWLRKNHFGMYSGVSAGIMIHSATKKVNGNKDTDSSVNFMFQLTGIGAEVGGEHVRGFAEFGVGEKGILCAGVRFKF